MPSTTGTPSTNRDRSCVASRELWRQLTELQLFAQVREWRKSKKSLEDEDERAHKSDSAANKVLPTSRRQSFSQIPRPARCRQHTGVHGKPPRLCHGAL